MLPIFISEAVSPIIILKILGIKLIIGIIAGIIIDLIIGLIDKNKGREEIEENEIGHICEEEHCHCDEKGIFKSAVSHTLNILLFIVLITFVINVIVHFVGEETIASWILNKPIIGPIITSLIGLIPNCGASIILTELYLNHILSFSALIAGLLTGSGVALLVLFKNNQYKKENLLILSLIYIIGVFSGLILTIFS